MKEKVYQFGAGVTLLGIVTEPALSKARPDLPAVILLNAGILHRVGPFRSSVNLARRLAAIGHVVMRLDLSGLGDSEVRKDSRSENQRALDDVREAIEFLSHTFGTQRFVLYGFCSGADYAHSILSTEPRIVGAVMIDAYGWRTPKWWWSRMSGLLFNMRKWRIFLKRKLRRPFAPARQETYVREFPPKEQVRGELEAVTARGVNLLFVYTAGFPHYFNYREQFFEMFGPADFLGRIDVEYYGQTDHTFFRFEDRMRLLDRICTWIGSRQWASPSLNLPGRRLPDPYTEVDKACSTTRAVPRAVDACRSREPGPYA
jgi:pimeloyl-ACP methyl ester carboxylesterase